MRRLVLACAIVSAAVSAYAGAGAAADKNEIRAGRQIYQAQCASCHGVRGEGMPKWEEPNAHGELPAPPHDPSGHTWKHADGMLYRMIDKGWRDPFNKTQHLTMPAFGQTLSPAEIRAVIEYLKTLWTPEQRRFQRDESARNPYPPEARRFASGHKAGRTTSRTKTKE